MIHNPQMYETLRLGVVVQRRPGVTRWAAHVWKATDVMPGAADADWHELRREGDVVVFHAATLVLELHGAETEAYLHGLTATDPCIYVIMRPGGTADAPLDMVLVTASPYEAQDYTDSGEELVEKVPMPPSVKDWIWSFVSRFHQEETFVKRKRDKKNIDGKEDGIGDARIAQVSDVYRSPAAARKERLQ